MLYYSFPVPYSMRYFVSRPPPVFLTAHVCTFTRFVGSSSLHAMKKNDEKRRMKKGEAGLVESKRFATGSISCSAGIGMFSPSRPLYRVMGVGNERDGNAAFTSHHRLPSHFSSRRSSFPSSSPSYTSPTHSGIPPSISPSSSQVLGADVPSFRHFPYCAQEVLHLYRSFLRLVYRYHRPEEHRDLLFRLRQEFAGRRHLQGRRVIAAALRRGQGKLEFYEQLLDARTARSRERRKRDRIGGLQSTSPPRRGNMEGEHGQQRKSSVEPNSAEPAICVDEVWQLLGNVSGHTLPGLSHYPRSLQLRDGTYHRQACTSQVLSRRF